MAICSRLFEDFYPATEKAMQDVFQNHSYYQIAAGNSISSESTWAFVAMIDLMPASPLGVLLIFEKLIFPKIQFLDKHESILLNEYSLVTKIIRTTKGCKIRIHFKTFS
ncbi:hypothetical protein DSL64_26635 [Dyadobacter luteus]|uniref:Uncharacterized protein n=1 Tax=Dyadobacter luteus TaxID=2259619 RepID=A0A3D8Y371_9BACT|nr:hypothetical protein DSL64_26635 [Dyadobacter luteus]